MCPARLATAGLIAALALPGGIAAAAPAISLAAVGLRAFSPNGDGVRDRLVARATLTVTSHLTITVRSYEGATVATLLDRDEPAGQMTVTWDGAGVPDGPYDLVATAATGRAQLHVARWSTLPQVPAAGRIVVVLDPGHGGADNGGGSRQLPDGTWLYEKDVTLDTAKKTAVMLSAAGFAVRLTRTDDASLSLAARVRLADAYRGDAFVSFHDNSLAPGEGRTEAFYCETACFGATSSRSLAQALLDAHRVRLRPFEDAAWQMTPSPTVGWSAMDDFVRWNEDGCFDPIVCHFAVLGPYDATRRPAALVMPGALIESLSGSQPIELAMLADPAVRTVLATAFADGIASYFASRAQGVRLELASALPRFSLGRSSTIRIRVTNTGTAAIPAGSRIVVGDRSRVTGYDASRTTGSTIGTATVGRDLPSGGTAVLSVRVTPRVRSSRTWKLDVVVDGVRLSAARIPTLQVATYVH